MCKAQNSLSGERKPSNISGVPPEILKPLALEAFTGKTAHAQPESPPADDFETRFVSALEEDGRDIEGRLLPLGTRILANPKAPHEFMEYTPANRQQFVVGHHAWTAGTRSAEWFPCLRDLPASFHEDIERAQSAKLNFMTAIEENVQASVGRAFPDMRVPSFVALLPWQHRVKHADSAGDETDVLVKVLLREAGCPADTTVPNEWETALASINGLKLFKVSSVHAEFVVAAAFVSAIRFADGPSLTAPGPATVDLIRNVTSERLCELGNGGENASFVTIGATSPWPSGIELPSEGATCIVLASQKTSGEWATVLPPVFATKPVFRDFIDRLKPETRQQRISRIKTAVDKVLDTGYEGNLTVEKVAKETAYRRTQVRNAFLALQKSGHYRIYRRKGDKQVAIRMSTPGEPISLTASAFRPGWLRRHILHLCGAACCVGGWGIKDFIPVHGVMGALLFIFVIHVTGLMQKELNRRAAEKKE